MTDTTGYNIRPLLAGLVDAGFISESRDVERVIIDIEGGCSPQVYVQYAGDPDKLTAVLEHIARSMPIVETSTPRSTSADDLLRAGNYERARVQVPTHRGNPLGYAGAVELQRLRDIEDETMLRTDREPPMQLLDAAAVEQQRRTDTGGSDE